MPLMILLLALVLLLLQPSSAFVPPTKSSHRHIPRPITSYFTLSPISSATALQYSKNATLDADAHVVGHRFERTAPDQVQADRPCILTIHGKRYNMTKWANAHPGGVKVLERLHGKDGTKAFEGAHHSMAAVAMLQDFVLDDKDTGAIAISDQKSTSRVSPRWRAKLFTKEDPIGIHKYMGFFCLLHFAFRFYQMFFGDPAAGLGMRVNRGPNRVALLCLVPHALLSTSSLIFHTVPKERIVGKPMIWQEYRIHNIGFGLRSIAAAALCSIAIHGGNTPALRRMAVWGSCLASLAALVSADLATHMLRANEQESTTATMPYWEGCSKVTQKRFKSFYAYCQFLATMGCLAVTNPAWPLSILLAIQLASLLMTLVRKGLLTARQYHLGYTAALVAPFFVALRSMLVKKCYTEVVGLFALGGVLYQLRRRGVNKYLLWLPVMIARVTVGDTLLSWDVGW